MQHQPASSRMSSLLPVLLLLVAAAAVGTVSAQPDSCMPADPATCSRTELCNGQMCHFVCEDGSVEVDDWLIYAQATQRVIQMDKPFLLYQMPSTHNSAVSNAYGIGVENNFLSSVLETAGYSPKNDCLVIINDNLYGLKDQLLMGVRHFELDLHWINGAPRECHWDGPPADFMQLLSQIEQENNFNFEWDPQRMGCFNSSLLIADLLNILQSFLEANPTEFLQIYMDDRVEYDRLPDLVSLMQQILGANHVLTPPVLQNQYNGVWPSVRTLLADGYRVVVSNMNENFYNSTIGNDFWFSPPYWFSGQFDPTDFEPATCSFDGHFLYGQIFTRPVDESLVLGPLDDETDNGRFIVTPEMMQQYQFCGVNYISMNELDPVKAHGFIWTWDETTLQPASTSAPDNCVALNQNGRWQTMPCATLLPVACQNATAALDWQLASASSFANAAAACAALQPEGRIFGLPTDGYEATQLAEKAKATSPVWINYVAAPEPMDVRLPDSLYANYFKASA